VTDVVVSVAVAALVLLVAFWLGWRRQRWRQDDPEWVDRWRELGRARRRRILRAVRKGRAVDDPRDAEVAADLAVRLQRTKPGTWKGFGGDALPIALAVPATLLALSSRDPVALGFGALPLVTTTFLVAWARRLRRHAREAERANRELAAQV
jgi:hypothetical protein